MTAREDARRLRQWRKRVARIVEAHWRRNVLGPRPALVFPVWADMPDGWALRWLSRGAPVA